jgi:hypothetical protein
VIGDATTYAVESCREYTDMRFTVTLDRIEIVQGGEFEQDFDIEAELTAGENYYWLLHNSGHRFTREELAAGGETAIFEFSTTPGTFMEFYVADFGNGATGRKGWYRNKRIEYPFDFETVPHEFSIFETTSDADYNNTTVEVFFTIQRELIDPTK